METHQIISFFSIVFASYEQNMYTAVLSRVFDDDEDEKEDSSRLDSKSKRKKKKELYSPISSMRNSSPGLANYSRKVYKAKVVGVDPGKDIAVLKIEAPAYDLYPIDVGTSAGLRVGQSGEFALFLS
jgi:hypothetical protein